MIAVVPVRGGELPVGALETIAEADGRTLLIGSGVVEAADALLGHATEVCLCEAGEFAPSRWSQKLARALVDVPLIMLPASPDGRDLAPRIAAQLSRPLVTSAIRVASGSIQAVTQGGLAMETRLFSTEDRLVVTFQPGARTARPDHGIGPGKRTTLDAGRTDAHPGERDAVVVEVLPADVATMDLSEAPRLLGGGAGLDSPARFEQLSGIAERLGASMGATRVITDRGWLGHERQIGTTGVVVDPDLYLAFAISGAVQHTAGLGDPDHMISVNTDEHCPMMQLADLAIVADANQTIDHLDRLIGIEASSDEARVDPIAGSQPATGGDRIG